MRDSELTAASFAGFAVSADARNRYLESGHLRTGYARKSTDQRQSRASHGYANAAAGHGGSGSNPRPHCRQRATIARPHPPAVTEAEDRQPDAGRGPCTPRKFSGAAPKASIRAGSSSLHAGPAVRCCYAAASDADPAAAGTSGAEATAAAAAVSAARDGTGRGAASAAGSAAAHALAGTTGPGSRCRRWCSASPSRGRRRATRTTDRRTGRVQPRNTDAGSLRPPSPSAPRHAGLPRAGGLLRRDDGRRGRRPRPSGTRRARRQRGCSMPPRASPARRAQVPAPRPRPTPRPPAAAHGAGAGRPGTRQVGRWRCSLCHGRRTWSSSRARSTRGSWTALGAPRGSGASATPRSRPRRGAATARSTSACSPPRARARAGSIRPCSSCAAPPRSRAASRGLPRRAGSRCACRLRRTRGNSGTGGGTGSASCRSTTASCAPGSLWRTSSTARASSTARTAACTMAASCATSGQARGSCSPRTAPVGT